MSKSEDTKQLILDTAKKSSWKRDITMLPFAVLQNKLG